MCLESKGVFACYILIFLKKIAYVSSLRSCLAPKTRNFPNTNTLCNYPNCN